METRVDERNSARIAYGARLMRSLRRARILLLLPVLVVVAPSAAHADPPAESGRPKLDVAITGSLISIGVGSAYNYAHVGGMAHAHLSPYLRVGVRGALGGETEFLQDPAYKDQPYGVIDFGAHAEAHTRPKDGVDPWLGLGVGVRRVTQAPTDYKGDGDTGYAPIYGSDPPRGICRTDDPCWTGLVTAELGLDFHIHPNVALGFFTFARVPVPQKRRAVDPGASGGHLPQEASFHFLLPGLRVMAIF